MAIRVSYRTYKNSVLASLISLLGSLIDGLCRLLGLACMVGMFGEFGILGGLIPGFLLLTVCVAAGTAIRMLIVKLSDYIAVRKYKRQTEKH